MNNLEALKPENIPAFNEKTKKEEEEVKEKEEKEEKEELEDREAIREILKTSPIYHLLSEEEREKLIDRIIEYHRSKKEKNNIEKK